MIAVEITPFEAFLRRFDKETWERTLAELRNQIDEIDRNATEIWFRFYPLALHDLLAANEDGEQLARRLLLEGNYRLENQVHSSHRFLYAHRFWAEAKHAVERRADRNADFSEEKHVGDMLTETIRQINREVAASAKQDEALTLGITFVAVMTLRQVGFARFAAASAKVMLDREHLKRTPDQILRERAKDDYQGLFGFLKTEDKTWTVTFDETTRDGKFKCINGEELASGAARDARDWQKVDPRCVAGAIPVQCRAAACGTCWVGVLGGADKLSPVTRFEGKNIKEFGYINTAEERPLIRLACMAQTSGAVSIVIPPWNGVFGKAVENSKPAGQENLKD